MDVTEVRIPGKLMLSGEYAVMHGGWAVLVTVPRYLKVRETDTPPERPVSPVLTESLAEPIPELAGFEKSNPLRDVAVDRDEFYATAPDGRRTKLGLGSSAAEAVGIVALRFERAGVPWKQHRLRVAELAEAAHRRAQGGIGSGADVAACAIEEPIRFRREGDGFKVERIEPTAEGRGLPLALTWTGVSADTREFVQHFEAWLARDPGATFLLEELVDASNELAGAWFRESQAGLFLRMDDFVTAMQACARGAGIDWRLPVHDTLATWAHERNGRAKPTGAGGGDLVLLAGDLPLEERSEWTLPLRPFPGTPA